MTNVKISLCQYEVEPHPSFEHFKNKVMMMMADVPSDSHYVLFPEVFTFGLTRALDNYEKLEFEDLGKTEAFSTEYISFFSELAKQRKQVIIAGTTLHKVNEELHNMCFVFDENGQHARHSKTHLFPPERATGSVEGSSYEVLQVGPAKIGIAICYEMQIPEIATILAEQGAEIIFCPSHTSQYGYYRVSHCARARAIENQLYVAYCPTLGNPQVPDLHGHGKAGIFSPCDDPWPLDGVIVEAEMDKPMVVTGEVDIDLLYENREHGTTRTYNDRNRRRDLYNQYRPYRSE